MDDGCWMLEKETSKIKLFSSLKAKIQKVRNFFKKVSNFGVKIAVTLDS